MIDLRSKASMIVAFSISSDVTTETATGTYCNVFSFLVAVTITSSTILSCANVIDVKIKAMDKLI